jgi:polysaccharide biosynthesis transport protein
MLTRSPSPGTAVLRRNALPRIGAKRAIDNQGGSEIDIRRVFLAAKRRRWLIVVITLIVTGISGGVGALMTPRYKAETSLVLTIKDGSNSNNTIGGMSGGISSKDTPQISSAIDVLTSPDTVRRVVQALGLVRDAEWNPALRPPGIVAKLRRALPYGLRAAGTDETPTAAQQLAMTQAAVRHRLSVTNDGKSYTIIVSMMSADPHKAAAIANAIAETYAAKDLGGRSAELDHMSTLLLQRSEGLRARVIATETAVQDYKDKNGIVDLGDKSLVNDALTKLNTELVASQTERAKTQAMLTNLKEFSRKRNAEAAAKVAAISTSLATLVDQRNQVRANLADLGTTYSSKYPKLQEMKSRSKEIDEQLAREIQQEMAGLQARVDVARANEAAIKSNVTKLTATNRANARAGTELQQLMADAATAHSLYQTFLDAAGRAAVESYALAGNARIDAPATAPAFPASPQIPIILLVGAIAGFLIAIASAIALEALRKEVYTPEEVRDDLGQSTLAVLPYLARAKSWDAHAARVMSIDAIENPLGEHAEALRSVGVALTTSPGLHAPKVIMVTSALPGEGKTSLAVSLARLAAASGRSVLLIECDLRRPAVNRALGVVAPAGLTDVLAGHRTLSETSYEDPVSGMHVVPSGSRASFPAEALGSERMRGLISASRDRFDLVILDTPPVGIVADSLVLSDLVDAAILVVRWGKTPRRTVTMALDRLVFAGVRMAGVVLTQVRMKKFAQYGSDYRGVGAQGYFEKTRATALHATADRLG